jgi:hypothetical protein
MADSSPSPQQRTITIRTRRKIPELLGSVEYSGTLNDLEFLSRLYDLRALPSHDTRYKTAYEDVWKHCVVNRDWKRNWVFADRRFGLDDGPDTVVLRFLAEMLHPDVREIDEAARLAQDFNSLLANDGWELVPDRTRGRHPIYTWREHQTSNVTAAPGFPMVAEKFIAALVELMNHRGTERQRSILEQSEYTISRASYDNWDGGITGWDIACACPTPIYVQFSETERTKAEATISSCATEILRAHPKHHVAHVVISPAVTAAGRSPSGGIGGSLTPAASPSAPLPTGERPRAFAYDVALSFAGEDRNHAEAVAALLKDKGVQVFYDLFEQAALWGKDLYQHLQTVYRDRARFCVIFVSAAYAKKLWTRHELQQAQARAFTEHAEYILPVRLDETALPGLNPTIGYIDGRAHDAATIVDMLLKKLAEPHTT